MSAKHRCPECLHRPGPRRINRGKDGLTDKKASCNHECHRKAEKK